MEIDSPIITIPDELRSAELEMGVDETGRGAVLGPMIYAGAFAPINFEWPKEVNDSKQINSEKRESIMSNLKNLPIGFVLRSLSAEEISAKMLGRHPISLNAMAHTATREIVKTVLDAGLNIKALYIDAVGNCESYQKSLKETFPMLDITVKEKADATYKVVGAASIYAKVYRDHSMLDYELKEKDIELNKDYGSGYPGDPKCANWVDDHFDNVFGYPSIARFSWTPIANKFVEKKSVAIFDEYPGSRFPPDSAYFSNRRLRTAKF